jgi:hypothetical protein
MHKEVMIAAVNPVKKIIASFDALQVTYEERSII